MLKELREILGLQEERIPRIFRDFKVTGFGASARWNCWKKPEDRLPGSPFVKDEGGKVTASSFCF
ncbi:MAG: hypothetical protein V9H25_00650 [Candidatus Competibacter sp.]